MKKLSIQQLLQYLTIVHFKIGYPLVAFQKYQHHEHKHIQGMVPSKISELKKQKIEKNNKKPCFLIKRSILICKRMKYNRRKEEIIKD